MAKVRFDYALVGLAKVDGVVTFDGVEIVSQLDGMGYHKAMKAAANYGVFVKATRALAGHESDTIAEKKELIKEVIDWYMADCPKVERKNAVKVDPFIETCKTIMASDAKPAIKKSTIQAIEVAYGRKFEMPAAE